MGCKRKKRRVKHWRFKRNVMVVVSVGSVCVLFALSNTTKASEDDGSLAVYIQKLSDSDSDSEEELKLYEVILKHNPQANMDYVSNIIEAPYVLSNFYNNVIKVVDPDDVLVLVNKNFQLGNDYEPQDLVIPSVRMFDDSKSNNNFLREVAAVHLEEMFAQAEKDGVVLYARSGYRSYETQNMLYERYAKDNGYTKADTFSARAGFSEHQTGLSVDVTSDSVNRGLSNEFHKTKEGSWVQENAHKFGFIVRFAEGKEHLTGYQFEPWHIRYVGIEVASEIYENNWLLEDYLLMYNLI